MITNSLTAKSFGIFIASVLRQLASKENVTIDFETTYKGAKDHYPYRFDAIVEEKNNNYNQLYLFEFKYSFSRSAVKSFLRNTKKLINEIDIDNTYVVPVIITNSSVEDWGEFYDNVKYRNLIIVDEKTVFRWIQEYRVDYYNASNVSNTYLKEEKSTLNIDEFEFAEKRNSNINVLSKSARTKDNFALVLGAGISIEPGAKTWDQLMQHMFNNILTKGLIKDKDSICKKIGESVLISAQLCKEVYRNEKDFYWDLHECLYKNRKAINPNYSIYEVAKLIERLQGKRNFRILTYNFDDYLESYLDEEKVSYNTLFDDDCEANGFVPIYHVHGYLPKTSSKTSLDERYMNSIFLTEESYNKLYNHPYSWPISTQLSFFRENICLFIGCSLTDPNIRRLLEIAKNDSRPHYAILKRDSVGINDLAAITHHFSRMGVEIIWIDDYKEINIILQKI